MPSSFLQYLTDHSNQCDFDVCVPKLISSFITRRARATLPERRVDRLLKKLDKADVTQASFRRSQQEHLELSFGICRH